MAMGWGYLTKTSLQAQAIKEKQLLDIHKVKIVRVATSILTQKVTFMEKVMHQTNIQIFNEVALAAMALNQKMMVNKTLKLQHYGLPTTISSMIEDIEWKGILRMGSRLKKKIVL